MKKEHIKGEEAKSLLDAILSVTEESADLEFKRLAGSRTVSKILETIAAMANTAGGHIVIGVDDPEKSQLIGRDRFFGIEEDPDNFDALMRSIGEITPLLPADKNTVFMLHDDVSDKTIALMAIAKAEKDFYILSKKAFIREDKSNRLLSPLEFRDMSYAKGFKKADAELLEGVDIGLLDTEWFQGWRQSRKLTGSIEDVLLQSGLARKNDSGQVLPTRAAVLLFARLPDSLSGSDRCAIRIFRYQGTEAKFGRVPNLVARPINIEGPVVKLIDDTSRRVLDIIATGVEIESGFVNKHEVPERVVKEAITNAVIHRDYHDQKDIEIRIYEDRVEVVSPGMLVYNITLHNIGKERALGYRNALLVKHLREFPDAPNMDANEGVKAMIREMRTNKLYPPTYFTWPTKDDLGFVHYVKLVLFNKNTPDEWIKIADYLRHNSHINNSKARELTGVVQTAAMSKMLNKWLAQGLIERVVNGNAGRRHARYRLKTRKEFEGRLQKQEP